MPHLLPDVGLCRCAVAVNQALGDAARDHVAAERHAERDARGRDWPTGLVCDDAPSRLPRRQLPGSRGFPMRRFSVPFLLVVAVLLVSVITLSVRPSVIAQEATPSGMTTAAHPLIG